MFGTLFLTYKLNPLVPLMCVEFYLLLKVAELIDSGALIEGKEIPYLGKAQLYLG